MNASCKTKKRFFVLGCDRSGTSLLRRVLNAHSQVACPAETKFIFQLIKVVETEQSYQGLESMEYTRPEILRRLADFIDSFLDEYAERQNKKIWVEKTTHNIFYAELLDEIFEKDVSFIGLVRHGLDVAYSLENVQHSPFTVIEQFQETGDDRATTAMRFWKSQNRRILQLQERFGSRLQIFKYEDLTVNPEEEFKRLFDYIGVPFESSAIYQYNDFPHTGGFEDPNAIHLREIVNRSSQYKKWDTEKQEKLYALACDELSSFGYKV